jgi:hypothetical protein
MKTYCNIWHHRPPGGDENKNRLEQCPLFMENRDLKSHNQAGTLSPQFVPNREV